MQSAAADTTATAGQLGFAPGDAPGDSLEAAYTDDWEALNALAPRRRRYEVRKMIGHGSYGTVCAATDLATGEAVAIKRVARAFDQQADAVRTLRELTLLRLLRHPNVVQLREVQHPRRGFNACSKPGDDVFLVCERMETDLATVIKSRTKLQAPHIEWLAYQLLAALAYLHASGVVHRDLKPANLLVNAACNLRVCDFGMARAAVGLPEQTELGGPGHWTSYVATRWYRAPELICGYRCDAPGTLGACGGRAGVDIWAAGCILAELLLRTPLFPGQTIYQQVEYIVNLAGPPVPATIRRLRGRHARRHVQNLVARTLHYDTVWPNTALAQCGEPAAALVREMLRFDPAGRVSAAAAQGHRFFVSCGPSQYAGVCAPPLDPSVVAESFAWEGGLECNFGAVTAPAELRRRIAAEAEVAPRFMPAGAADMHAWSRGSKGRATTAGLVSQFEAAEAAAGFSWHSHRPAEAVPARPEGPRRALPTRAEGEGGEVVASLPGDLNDAPGTAVSRDAHLSAGSAAGCHGLSPLGVPLPSLSNGSARSTVRRSRSSRSSSPLSSRSSGSGSSAGSAVEVPPSPPGEAPSTIHTRHPPTQTPAALAGPFEGGITRAGAARKGGAAGRARLREQSVRLAQAGDGSAGSCVLM
jgi:serine/threonine protein kinase